MAAKSSSGRGNTFKDGRLGGGPQETTRLLLDTARIAHNTEDIGT
jgi:hypothetical protein